MSDVNARPILVPTLRVAAVFAIAVFFPLATTGHFGVATWAEASVVSILGYNFYGFLLGFPLRAVMGSALGRPGFAYVAVLVLASSFSAFAIAVPALSMSKLVVFALLETAFFWTIWVAGIGFGLCPKIKTILPEKAG